MTSKIKFDSELNCKEVARIFSEHNVLFYNLYKFENSFTGLCTVVELERISNKASADKLKKLGILIKVSREALARKTIFCRDINTFIISKSEEAIVQKVNKDPRVQVDSIKKIGHKMLKIKLKSEKMRVHALEKGLN